MGSPTRERLESSGQGPAGANSVVLSRDFRLGNGLQSRINHDDSQDRVAIVSAIQLERRAAEMVPLVAGKGRSGGWVKGINKTVPGGFVL